jgi:hypothetical protein
MKVTTKSYMEGENETLRLVPSKTARQCAIRYSKSKRGLKRSRTDPD